MRKGFILPLLGLIAGLLIGSGILLFKRYLGKELMGLLAGELHGSCRQESSCELAYDSIDISLLTLKASANNVRIHENGVRKLAFNRIEGDFSLRHLGERKIFLDELRLYDGYSDGVGPESTTFRFIDFMAAPIPPERDRPDRYRLKLQRLRLFNSGFTEDVSGRALKGKGATLTLKRTPQDTFSLDFAVPTLGNTEIQGSISASLLIAEDEIRVAPINANSAGIKIAGELNIRPENVDYLNGTLHVRFLPHELLGPQSALDAEIEAHVLLAGHAGGIRASSNFGLSASRSHMVRLKEMSPILLSSLSGMLELEHANGVTTFKVPSFSCESDRGSVRLETPLSGSWHGSLEIPLQLTALPLELSDVSIGAIASRIVLRSEFPPAQSTPPFQIQAAGTVQHLTTQDISSGPISFSIDGDSKALSFKLENRPDGAGKFEASGTVVLHPDLATENIAARFSAIPLGSSNVLLSGTANMSGGLSLPALTGSGTLSVTRKSAGHEYAILDASAGISGGVLLLEGTSSRAPLTASLEIDFLRAKSGHLRITSPGMNPFDFVSDHPQEGSERHCGKLIFDGTYEFPLEAALAGQGSLVLSEMRLGCVPYQIGLTQSVALPIAKGTLSLSNLALRAHAAELLLNGGISLKDGIDIAARGDLELASLLSFTPAFDDLSGSVRVDARIKGPMHAPQIFGEAILRDGTLDIESAQLSLSDMQAHTRITERGLDISELSGRIDQGTFAAHGNVDVLDLARSALTIEMHNVLVEPLPNTLVRFSSDLSLSAGDGGRPRLSGVVQLHEAEFQQEINLGSIIRSAANTLLRRPLAVPDISQNVALPAVDLAVEISAPGNILILTNFATVELESQLLLAGTTQAPTLAGKTEVISGWVGLRDRRFDINSGTITFSPDSLTPQLDLTAETTARTREGDLVLVLLEARGPLYRPKIRLESDRGLRERELLALLTASRSLTSERRLATIGPEIEFGGLGVSDEEEFFWLGRLVKDLTRIDSLSLEPSFNTQRGDIEPVIIAKKRLFEHLTLVGETPLDSAENDASLRLSFEATPSLEIEALVETTGNDGVAAVGVDVGYTVLGDLLRFLELEVRGNSSVHTRHIRSASRLRDDSRITSDDFERLRTRVTDLYRDRGFLSAVVNIECEEYYAKASEAQETTASPQSPNYCKRLLISIEEGDISTVRKLAWTGQEIPAIVPVDKVLEIPADQPATDKFRARFAARLLRALRNEGFISARVEANYIPLTSETAALSDSQATPYTRDVILQISLFAGEPVSFIFQGSTAFTPEDFLRTINLFSRRQPFGKNTVNILVQNMERLYAERGYLFATIGVQSLRESESNRMSYIISIDEGPRVTVGAVTFSENEQISDQALRNLIMNDAPDVAENILTPQFAIGDAIEGHAKIIADLLVNQGFPDVRVTSRLIPDETTSTVTIDYVVREGRREINDWLTVSGFPADIPLPPEPRAPYSIPEANSYVELLLETLKSEGFEQPTIHSRLDMGTSAQEREAAGGVLVLEVEKGQRCAIADIRVEGNQHVSEDVISRAHAIQRGDPLREEALEEGRRRLFRLGLFSRASFDIESLRNDPCEKRLVVRVTERPLRTLKVGGGVNSEFGLHVFGEATDWEIFADGRNISARVDTYYDRVQAEISQGVASLTFSNPSLFWSPYGLVSDLRFQKLDLDSFEYDLDRLSWSHYIRRAWEDDLTVSTGYTILRENLDNVAPGAVLSSLDEGNVTLGFASGIITYDGRDDPLNPREGISTSLDFQLAANELGSDGNFFGSAAHATLHEPLRILSENFGILWNVRAGSQWAFGNDDFVPITQRLYLGGRTSLRGFRENSLGPLADDGSIIGGDLLLAQNFEFHYEASENLLVLGFFDAGGLFLRDRGVSFDDVRESAGVGVRFRSPIGPIGFDVGVPLDERSGEPSFRIHFNVGTNF